MVSPPSSSNYRVQPTPKLSANQLAAYMVATDVGKERIIQAAHWQRKIVVIQYKEVRTAISRYLASPTRDGKILAEAVALLQATVDSATTKPATKENAQRSIAAIKLFQQGYNSFELGGMTFRLPPHNQPPLIIEKVEVNVTMDALVEAVKKPGELLLGGVLLQPGKGNDSDTEDAKAKRRAVGSTAAMLVHMAVTDRGNGNGEPSRKHCLSIDIPRGEAHAAPTSHLTKTQHIKAACRQVAAMWNVVPPPPDYKP